MGSLNIQMQIKRFLVLVLFFVTLIYSATLDAQTANSGKFIVVLDAGHGGKDPGNLGSGYQEKKIALNIVLKVGAALEQNPNIEVIYTRKTDVFIELRERAAIANRADADLFVSVHCDSHHSEAHGAGTFVMSLDKSSQNLNTAKKENEVIFLEENYEENYEGFDPNKPESLIGISLLQEEYLDQSILLANYVQENMVKLKRKNRKVKQDVFWVLHNTYMPSVLVETGFLTYKKEGAYLDSSKGQNDMSNAITRAINKYLNALDANISNETYIIEEEVVEAPVVEEVQKEAEKEIIVPTEKRLIKNTVFKIQIAASSTKLKPKPYNFKGLKEISRDKESKLYKYFYGYTSDYNMALALKKNARAVGYKSAFIAAYRDGERISLEKALNDSLK